MTGYTLLVYLSGQPQQPPGAPMDVLTPPAAAAAARGGAAAAGGGGAKGASSKRLKQSGPAAAAAAAPSPTHQQQGGPAAAAAAPSSTSALQEVVGGETVFYDHRGRLVASVRPQAGLALLHLHGERRCLEHEGAEVLGGVKYVLRSDVVFASAAPASG